MNKFITNNKEFLEVIKHYDNNETLQLLLNASIDLKRTLIKELNLSKEGGFYRHLRNEFIYQTNKSHKDYILINNLLAIDDLL